jgi:hypothetical protein
MTSQEAEAFAADWAKAWNEQNIDWVLAHFHDEVEFTSPTALAVVGVSTVRGKRALHEYWIQALATLTSLFFALDRVVWDPERRELAMIYTSEANGKMKRVSENLTFDRYGFVVRGEVFHGVPG